MTSLTRRKNGPFHYAILRVGSTVVELPTNGHESKRIPRWIRARLMRAYNRTHQPKERIFTLSKGGA